MQLGDLIVSQVCHLEAVSVEQGDDFLLFGIAARQLDADKDLGRAAMGKAIVEFGDRALPEQPDEGTIAAPPLGDFDAE
ncbi:hypothetical protein D3C87_1790170 [compost metagenome]